MGKPVTVDDLRCPHGIHEALFNAKFQKHMKFAIMFETSPRWGATDETDMLENLMPFWMENYFKRENYLVIDNKPVLFVYNHRLESCFKSAETQKKTFDKCREYAKEHGFDGMIFASSDVSSDNANYEEQLSRGYDFTFGYSAGYRAPYDFYEDEDDIVKKQCEKFAAQLEINDKCFIPTASCFLDPTPRFSERWNNLGYKFREWSKIWYLSPQKFKELLFNLKKISDEIPDEAWAKKIIMIDNWNEWDEGHFVAPSHKFGFKYLQAIREVLTDCNNLPDYIAPHDQGFTGYNKSWKTPDFSKFCQEKLK